MSKTLSEPKATQPQVPAPQQPKAVQVSSPQQPKAVSVSTSQAIHDVLRSRPITTAGPTYDDIARRAYQIYVEKGRPQGQSEQNWRQAEQELRSRAFTASMSR